MNDSPASAEARAASEQPPAAALPPTPPAPERPNVPGLTTSPTIARLVTALAEAKQKFLPIEKTKTADAEKFTYDYADLAEVLAATTTPLAEHGLVVLQPVRVQGQTVTVTTLVAHTSGEWMAQELALSCRGVEDPQKVGSVLTYCRRYAYCAALGIQPKDEDDDGARGSEQAEARGRAKQARGRQTRQDAPREEPADEVRPAETDERPVTPQMVQRVKSLIKQHSLDEKQVGGYMRDTYGAHKWGDLQRRHFVPLCDLIQNWPTKQPTTEG